MEKKDVTELTDQELLAASKKAGLSPVANAFFIGFLGGIIVFSVVKNTWGFLTLIPLWLIYKAIQSSKRKTKLESMIKDRNLK